ncbi:uncharacterized protein MELLADRAFT_101572 [Melampsora larici-populina 98AG31]|uniref:Uncharacterized protein n=1 Tax=Melampsora larici-populina (strain 98AG31 / pathotype 3-4-7) TaxID=747676 RepID=F4R6A2_MELLP|nr:uncharacterized protein MELLADRAFT_101572 [Melampsora larici-populina 98AG31]EGG11845.1 hypothetical protein MELLADRAFT_101572 [Melampsora larici-populina 98AG31]
MACFAIRWDTPVVHFTALAKATLKTIEAFRCPSCPQALTTTSNPLALCIPGLPPSLLIPGLPLFTPSGHHQLLLPCLSTARQNLPHPGPDAGPSFSTHNKVKGPAPQPEPYPALAMGTKGRPQTWGAPYWKPVVLLVLAHLVSECCPLETLQLIFWTVKVLNCQQFLLLFLTCLKIFLLLHKISYLP